MFGLKPLIRSYTCLFYIKKQINGDTDFSPNFQYFMVLLTVLTTLLFRLQIKLSFKYFSSKVRYFQLFSKVNLKLIFCFVYVKKETCAELYNRIFYLDFAFHIFICYYLWEFKGSFTRKKCKIIIDISIYITY